MYKTNYYSTISILVFLAIALFIGLSIFPQSSEDGVDKAANVYVVFPKKDASGLSMFMSPADARDNIVSENKISMEYNWPENDFFAAIVKPLNGQTNFYTKNEDNRWPIASLTKLLTAVVAIENFGADTIIAVSQNVVNTEGAAGDLLAGEKYKAIDLIKAMVVVSSNDAAAAIAEHFGVEKFIELMRLKLADLKMKDTSIFDPTGLSALNQSTIGDLTKLISYIYEKHFEILKFSQKEVVSILDKKSGRVKALNNINIFASDVNFIGGKTGFLDESGGNLISVFKYSGNIEAERKSLSKTGSSATSSERSCDNDQCVLIIVLGAKDRYAATQKLYDQTMELRIK